MDQTPIKRRLAAILAADAVAYSKHMAEDEEGTIHTLAGHRTIIDGLIASFGGRIVGTAGDSVLAEFGSSVDAVRCAVDIQQALATRNNSLAESEQLLFRIGINLGDVIVEGNDILGDGVNVAARLESIADPGGICISSSIYDQVMGKLNLGFADMGQQSLKNIARPVRTYRLDRDGTPAHAHAHAASGTTSGATQSSTGRSPVVMVGAVVALVAVLGAAWMMTRRAQRTTRQITAAAQQDEAAGDAAKTRLLTAEAEKARAEAELARAQLAAATQAAASKPVAAPDTRPTASAAGAARPAGSATTPSPAAQPASPAPVVANAVPASAEPAQTAATATSYTGGTAEFHCENGDELADGRGVVRVANNVVTIESVAPGRGTTVTARGRLQDDGTLAVQVVGAGRGQRGGRQGGAGVGVFSGRLVNGRGTLTGPQGRCTVALALN